MPEQRNPKSGKLFWADKIISFRKFIDDNLQVIRCGLLCTTLTFGIYAASKFKGIRRYKHINTIPTALIQRRSKIYGNVKQLQCSRSGAIFLLFFHQRDRKERGHQFHQSVSCIIYALVYLDLQEVTDSGIYLFLQNWFQKTVL